LTWDQLAGRVRGLSGALTAQAPAGAVILLCGGSAADTVAWYLAGIAGGVSILPVHRATPAAEVESTARRSGASACTRASPVGGLPAMDPARTELVGPRAPGGVVLVSSGTTGASKLAVRTSRALDADAANVACATGLSPRDRVLLAVPACHSYGVDVIAAAVLAGATLDILEPFDPHAAAACLSRRTTVFPGVPVMFEALARGEPTARGGLRLAFSGGAPLPDRVLDAFAGRWGIGIGQLYGASELGSVTLCDPESTDYARGSVGTPMRGVSIRILDAADSRRILPSGETGQVAVRAPSMFTGYLDGEAPLADGHFLTGDLGSLDERGRLFITGRLKLLIDVGGLKVNPQEVEAALASHPGVAECVVVALPLSDTVTRLRAVYIPREPGRAPADASLREFLRSRLAPHQVPRVIEPVASLPRSPTGKVLRAAVAAC
jgi:long-chain acyl-CoA synthetase